MKICKTCGNLVSDMETNCSKCGTVSEITYLNQNNQMQQQGYQQPVQQYQQPVQQPQQYQQVVQPQQQVGQVLQFGNNEPTQKKKSSFSENLKKNYKPISICIILLLIILCTYLVVDNISLRKKVKLNSTSAVEPSYQIQDNTNNSNEIKIELDEDDEYNFEIPEGTYPKVSQRYVFFIDEAYTATAIEQSGGLSLLNTQTGATGWVAVNRATLATYREKKDSLKRSYENQGITITNIYDQVFHGKDALVFEMIKDDQPMLLIISDASTNECFILTITNTNIKTTQDTTTANDLMKMLSISEKL